MGGEGGLSLSAHVWRSSTANSSLVRLLDFADASGGNNIVVGFDDGVFSYEVWSGSTRLEAVTVSDPFPVETWTRVGVLHRASGKTTIYWDGVSKAQQNSLDRPVRTARALNWIGVGHRDGDACFEGAVRNVMVYASALTKPELELYQDGLVQYDGPHLAVSEGRSDGGGC